MNWDILLKALGAVAGALLVFYQIRNMLPRERTRLRSDLEILKLLDASDAHFKLVKDAVDKQVHDVYGTQESDTTSNVGKVFNGIIGIGWSASFAYWSFHLSREQFNWWSIATGLSALLGVLFTIGILSEDKRRSKQH